MKVCGQKMEVTLPVHGRERTFSEQELIAILEKHFQNEATEQATTERVTQVTTTKVAQAPTEGEWFEVKLQAIDQNLFKNKRENSRQENTRQLILEAFAELKKQPEKYGKNFKTMMPKKTWEVKTVAELKAMAGELGDHNADWVEQALEWAQRIVNGETWEAICNDRDTANWYRMVIWKNGYARLVGGSRDGYDTSPASDVYGDFYRSDDGLNYTVPLVVLY